MQTAFDVVLGGFMLLASFFMLRQRGDKDG